MTTINNTNTGHPSLGVHNLTTQPINIATHSQLSPEFVGAPEARMMFGISRTHLYNLSKDGLIHTVSLRGRGKTRGRRLYSVDSIRALLNAAMGGGQ
jgi:hypothetical protein